MFNNFHSILTEHLSNFYKFYRSVSIGLFSCITNVIFDKKLYFIASFAFTSLCKNFNCKHNLFCPFSDPSVSNTLNFSCSSKFVRVLLHVAYLPSSVIGWRRWGNFEHMSVWLLLYLFWLVSDQERRLGVLIDSQSLMLVTRDFFFLVEFGS